MNTKTTMTMAGVALVAGAVGLGVGVNATSRHTGVRREVPRAARIEPRDAAEVVRSRKRPEHAEPERTEVEAAAPNPASKPGPTFEERYAKAGRTLGVSAAALAAVTTAMTALHEHLVKRNPQTMAAQSEALAALESYGGEACRAAIAHLRATDRPNAGYVPIMDATWQPGMERHLLELARDPGLTPKQRQHAMHCLSLAGTSDVRDFLLAELEGAKNERLLAGAAQSLGWLKEKRAVPILERLLYRQGRDVMQGAILNGLGTLGSEEARRVLVEFVDKDHSTTLLLHAVRALQWSDTAAARTAARRILNGPHREKLTPNERLILEATAKP